jgi:hypothetical protein
MFIIQGPSPLETVGQGFQYFSSLAVLQYLQGVILLKFEQFS